MIELQLSEQMKKATERARLSNLMVQGRGRAGDYRVINKSSGGDYRVQVNSESGIVFGSCTCKAGSRNVICKHLAEVYNLHMWMEWAKEESQLFLID